MPTGTATLLGLGVGPPVSERIADFAQNLPSPDVFIATVVLGGLNKPRSHFLVLLGQTARSERGHLSPTSLAWLVRTLLRFGICHAFGCADVFKDRVVGTLCRTLRRVARDAPISAGVPSRLTIPKAMLFARMKQRPQKRERRNSTTAC